MFSNWELQKLNVFYLTYSLLIGRIIIGMNNTVVINYNYIFWRFSILIEYFNIRDSPVSATFCIIVRC